VLNFYGSKKIYIIIWNTQLNVFINYKCNNINFSYFVKSSKYITKLLKSCCNKNLILVIFVLLLSFLNSKLYCCFNKLIVEMDKTLIHINSLLWKFNFNDNGFFSIIFFELSNICSKCHKIHIMFDWINLVLNIVKWK